MRFEKWIPAFAGMTVKGVLGQSVSFLCKQESRNCETIDLRKLPLFSCRFNTYDAIVDLQPVFCKESDSVWVDYVFTAEDFLR